VAAEEWVGRVIDQRYVVESGLGAGGMGVVLRAKHRFTGQTVALKVLKPELSNDPSIQSRFLAEAQAPNAIGHPGIVRVHDAGRDPSGFLYLVMELLEGRSLRVPMVRGELGPLDASRIMLELLDALATAHARGFVHRDLKPDNVFLVAPNDSMRLLDFGIAKVLDGALARVRTATGITMGTPAYMSPEQLSDAAGVDARTDLWSCGVIIYEMLSGRLPFAATRPEQLLVAIATQNPDPIRAYLPHAPPELEGFFTRALARDPRMRFGAAAEMAHALTQLPLHQLRPQVAAAGPQMTPPASYAASSYAGSQAPASHPSVAAAATPLPAPQHATPIPQHAPSHHAPSHAPSQHAGPSHAAPSQHAAPAHAAPSVLAHAAPTASRTRTSTQPPPAKKSSPATLLVGLAAGAAVIVLVVLLVTKKSGSGATAAGSGSAVGSGSALVASAGSAGSGSSSAPPAGDTLPPPSRGGMIPSGDIGGGLKSRLEKIAGGEKGSDAQPPATTNTPRTTPSPTNTPRTTTPPAVTQSKEPADPYEAPPPESNRPEISCDAGCRAAARCGLVYNHAACLAECASDPKAKLCYDASTGNCGTAAQCAFAHTCGGKGPSGGSSCGEGLLCQTACTDAADAQCACRCANAVHPRHALQLARVDLCLLACNNNEQCAISKCKGLMETCLGRSLDQLQQ